MSEKHEKVQRTLNHFEFVLVSVSAVSGCVSISIVASLVIVSVVIAIFAVGLKICTMTVELKGISQSSRKRERRLITQRCYQKLR